MMTIHTNIICSHLAFLWVTLVRNGQITAINLRYIMTMMMDVMVMVIVMVIAMSMTITMTITMTMMKVLERPVKGYC